jgi:hypothetical protein
MKKQQLLTTLKNNTMIYTTKAQAKRLTGISYLGSVNMTTKHQKAFKYDELTYSLYLAPAKMSGYEVCPMRTKECTKLCLNESGMNTMNMNGDKINQSRIAKIKSAELKAKKLGYKFSVRLNNTSDITPESFYIHINDKPVNILQYFQHIQFYDYTKVPKRIELLKKYKNYDLTFSYSGHNLNECHSMLNKNVRVAVVFNEVPKTFWDRKVIDGDLYDMRYKDKKNVIVGLKYKRVRNKLTKNKFVIQL